MLTLIFYGFFLGRNDIAISSRYFQVLFPAMLFAFGVASFLTLLLQENYFANLIWLTIIVAANDTAAYFFGKRFGKTALITSISPNKTVEGALAGLLVATILGAVLYGMVGLCDRFICIVGLSFLIAFSATLGDLLESYLKRLAGVKDSSNILPGHGGVLDRVDAIMIAALFFFPITICLLYTSDAADE